MTEFLALIQALTQLAPVIEEVVDLLGKAVPGNHITPVITQIEQAIASLQGAVTTHKATAAAK